LFVISNWCGFKASGGRDGRRVKKQCAQVLYGKRADGSGKGRAREGEGKKR